MRMKIQRSKSLGYSKNSPKREIHCNTSIPQKIGKNSNTEGNLAETGEETGERPENKTYMKQKRVNNDLSRIP